MIAARREWNRFCTREWPSGCKGPFAWREIDARTRARACEQLSTTEPSADSGLHSLRRTLAAAVALFEMEAEHINVAVRLRPLSEDERASQDRVVVELREDRSVALHEPNGTVSSSSYDAVFESTASNTDVFQLVVRDMLAQALAGKNATIFAYGQTGSGKTHTIEGLMALAASYIFSSISDTADREFLLKLSAVEVYNEVVHDLLRRGSGRMELTEIKPGKVIVKNVLEESLTSAGQLHRLLNNVRDHRKARLPRSHASRLHLYPRLSIRNGCDFLIHCSLAVAACARARQAHLLNAQRTGCPSCRSARHRTTSTAPARTRLSPSWSRAATGQQVLAHPVAPAHQAALPQRSHAAQTRPQSIQRSHLST